MDQSISQLNRDYLLNLAYYNKLLLQRNSVLKANLKSPASIHALLDTYDAQMRKPARTLFEERKRFVSEFEPFFNKYYSIVSNSREHVSVKYSTEMYSDSWKDLQLSSSRKI